MNKTMAILAAAFGCVSFSGCVSSGTRVLDPMRGVPYQTYAGPPLPGEQTASLMLLTETGDSAAGTPIGWVRVLEFDGLDVSKLPNTWARVTPGVHSFRTICRSGPLHGGVRQWTATFDANMSYVWQIDIVKDADNSSKCQPALARAPGVDKGAIASTPGR